jgi:hypothetical protein
LAYLKRERYFSIKKKERKEKGAMGTAAGRRNFIIFINPFLINILKLIQKNIYKIDYFGRANAIVAHCCTTCTGVIRGATQA